MHLLRDRASYVQLKVSEADLNGSGGALQGFTCLPLAFVANRFESYPQDHLVYGVSHTGALDAQLYGIADPVFPSWQGILLASSFPNQHLAWPISFAYDELQQSDKRQFRFVVLGVSRATNIGVGTVVLEVA